MQPADFNPEGHYDRTPKFDPKFDLYRLVRNPFGGPPGLGPRPSRIPQSDKAPVIRGGSIPEIQDDIVNRDRTRMDRTFNDEFSMRHHGKMPDEQEKALKREEEEQQRQRENDIREMSELDRRTPKYGKFEGFPLPPGPRPPEWKIPRR
tara:strand:+ start:1147 stop:1593 length:447 start_codon:yes stop_codon:yes gene_type:complete